MCRRVFWNDNSLGPISGRSMDWPVSTEPMLTVFPRGIERNGGVLLGDVLFDNAISWRSKYGSLVTTIYGAGAADGVNEAGLVVHMLYLNATDFGVLDPAQPALHAGVWAQYLLDNAATVEEALALQASLQVAMIELHGFKSNVHLAMEDASGDSAIVEYVGGEPVIHHGREFRVMTNDPTYDEQLRLLEQQDYSKPSRDMPLPGNVNAVDRFQRATYYAALMPAPPNERQAIASMLSVIRNVSVPFGAPYGEFGVHNTEYRTVTNVATMRYFFELTTSPNVLWVDVRAFDFTEGSPVLALDPDSLELSGSVNQAFAEVPAPY